MEATHTDPGQPHVFADGDTRLVGARRCPYVSPQLVELRLTETRPVARLMHRVARDYPQDKPLFRAAFGLVVIADHLNAIIAGLGDYAPPLGAPEDPFDWSGLPVSAAVAKRATLCIHACRAEEALAQGLRGKCLGICEATATALGRGGA
jgi:hypothetical protein